MRIVFLGTPEFAVASLKALISGGFQVVAVVTAPDRLGGRGMKQLIESEVKLYARENDLPVLQPTNLKSAEFQDALKAYRADLQIVVAFRMLPEAVWNMPPLGTYNLHASLLPQYRGAAPINWAIINGEEYTGVTSFKLKHEIDTGNIAFQTRVEISEEDTAGSLHDKLMAEGAELIVQTVSAIQDGSIILQSQDESVVSKAPKIYHEDCQINFNKDVKEVHDFIRGLSPYPTAWTILDGKKLKIYQCKYEDCDTTEAPGKLECNYRDRITIVCKRGKIVLKEIQLEGRKRMDIRAFLNGCRQGDFDHLIL